MQNVLCINLRATTVRYLLSRTSSTVGVDGTTVLCTANPCLARVRMGDGICCRKLIAIELRIKSGHKHSVLPQ
jgi:hypothetical protein